MKLLKKMLSFAAVTSMMTMLFAGTAPAFTVYDASSGGWDSWVTAQYPYSVAYMNVVDFSQTNPLTPPGGVLTPYPRDLLSPPPFNAPPFNTVNSSVTTNLGYINAQYWLDLPSSSNGAKSTFSFNKPAIAFGAFFDLNNTAIFGPQAAGPGLKILITDILNGTTTFTINSTVYQDWWGIIADPNDKEIKSVEISAITTGIPGNEWYTLTDLSYTTVPEPSTFVLIGAGLSGLAFLRRRRKP